MKSYKSPVKSAVYEYTIKKSKFITYLYPIDGMADAMAAIAKISKKHSDATHCCYAYISNTDGTEQRFSDDGEPQGTAGVPMLEILKKRNMAMTLAVTVRYFGGIKLGGGGLVSAYAHGVAAGLDNAVTAENLYSQSFRLTVSYHSLLAAESALNSISAICRQIIYGDKVDMLIAVRLDNFSELVSRLNNATMGDCVIERTHTGYVQYI